MKNCSVCGKSVRKTQLAYVAEGGALTRKRVCSGCVFDRGFTIIAAEAVSKCKCGQPATKCGACAHPVDDGAIPKIVKALKGRVDGYNRIPIDPRNNEARQFVEGRTEGLEQAIAFLESGRW